MSCWARSAVITTHTLANADTNMRAVALTNVVVYRCACVAAGAMLHFIVAGAGVASWSVRRRRHIGIHRVCWICCVCVLLMWLLLLLLLLLLHQPFLGLRCWSIGCHTRSCCRLCWNVAFIEKRKSRVGKKLKCEAAGFVDSFYLHSSRLQSNYCTLLKIALFCVLMFIHPYDHTCTRV